MVSVRRSRKKSKKPPRCNPNPQPHVVTALRLENHAPRQRKHGPPTQAGKQVAPQGRPTIRAIGASNLHFKSRAQPPTHSFISTVASNLRPINRPQPTNHMPHQPKQPGPPEPPPSTYHQSGCQTWVFEPQGFGEEAGFGKTEFRDPVPSPSDLSVGVMQALHSPDSSGANYRLELPPHGFTNAVLRCVTLLLVDVNIVSV